MRSCFLMTLMALAAFTFIVTLQQAQSATLSFLMPENAKGFVLFKSPVAKREDTFVHLVTENTETTEVPEEHNTDNPKQTRSGGHQENVTGTTSINPESTTEQYTAGPKAWSETEVQWTHEPSEAVTVEAQESTTESKTYPFILYTKGVDTLGTKETYSETTEAQNSTIPPNPTYVSSQTQETHAPVEAETATAKPYWSTYSEAHEKTTEAQKIPTYPLDFTDGNVTETPEPEEA